MKKILYPVLSILVLGACSNETDELNDLNLGNVNSKEYIYSPELNLNIEKRKDILVFDSNEDFQKTVSKLSLYPINEARLKSYQLDNSDGSIESIIPIRDITLQDKGFHSLYDDFTNAMNEAESYYDRLGGYEEFKEKYSMLYFPEEGDDYSAYLPVSDKNIAKLLNSKGEVIIGGNTVNLLDISSYEQLKQLGLTPPSQKVETRSNTNGDDGVLLKGIRANNRELWVEPLRRIFAAYPVGEGLIIEVCFRKRGAFGIWYNYSSETSLKFYFDSHSERTMTGFSSHDYFFPRAFTREGKRVPFRALMGVRFRGFGKHGGDGYTPFEVYEKNVPEF